ncbi:hypothetical protein ABRP77_15275 [Pectobacterium odoriferum]|uniref:hypothetical protein n=1 Tax=Pectobacterium odoriferum TaxID=78398 RepID=UPI0032ED1CA8
MMNKKLSLGLLLVLSFFLTDCDSEPSDADVSKAMQSFTEEMNKGAPSESARVVFNSAKKIACKEKTATAVTDAQSNTMQSSRFWVKEHRLWSLSSLNLKASGKSRRRNN